MLVKQNEKEILALQQIILYHKRKIIIVEYGIVYYSLKSCKSCAFNGIVWETTLIFAELIRRPDTWNFNR